MKADKENDKNMVKRIKKCKCYYDMLGVPRDATDSGIQKAYQKLALKLHPDNNKAPGSADAFKSLENAVSILTDGQKRKDYDLVGDVNRYENSFGRNGKNETKFDVKSLTWICATSIVVLAVVLSIDFQMFLTPENSDPFYSLQRTPTYFVERRTVNLKIPYYVKESFLSVYKGSLNQLEHSVEEEYKQHMEPGAPTSADY